MFTTPGADQRTVHVRSAVDPSDMARYNPETETFEPAYFPENDVLTVVVNPGTLSEDDRVDQFTNSLEETEQGIDMVLRWILTEVQIPMAPV